MIAPLPLRVHAELDRISGHFPALGVALSGGGDSMALLHLAQGWAGSRRLMAATVDHGLRPESADEARFAAHSAAHLGISHDILTWRTAPGHGNLMAAARNARLDLLSDWARRNGLHAVLLGHTRDDQAETLVMRLRRGAGVDGLAGMAPVRNARGMVWLRPLLAIGRDDLRDWLRAQGTPWIDDPTNDSAAFERIRTRKAMAALDLCAHNLAQVAANMAQAREALQHYALQTVQGAQTRAGALLLPDRPFLTAPPEIRRRILVAALRWLSGADYPARREAIAAALRQIDAGQRLTLQGAIVQRRRGWLHVLREPAAAQLAPPASPDAQGCAIWDGRWLVHGLAADHKVRAVTHAPLSDLDWRRRGLTRDEAAASPAIWQDGRFLAAPLLMDAPDFTIKPLRDMGLFRALLVSH